MSKSEEPVEQEKLETGDFGLRADVSALHLLHYIATRCPKSRTTQDAAIGTLLKSGQASTEAVAILLESLSAAGSAYGARDALIVRLLRDGAITARETQDLLLQSEPEEPKPDAFSCSCKKKQVAVPRAKVIQSVIQTLMTISALLLGFTHANFRMLWPDALDGADDRWVGVMWLAEY